MRIPFPVVWVACFAVLANGNTVLAQDAPTLQYGWKVNEPHGYQFQADFDSDGKTRTTTGYVTYQLRESNVAEDFSGESFHSIIEGEATSTAFAVTNDGYLLTCEHCIADATEIKVVVGDREYDAKVIDSDEDLDLAVIKIAATDLKTVSLAKDRKVQLAQDVRAIGYPLSDVLGSSVKVTRGSVAGFVKLNESQNIQVDVAVNFGNSGGPLLDDTGAVVGVVNAKLSGQRISKVGFAVPIDYACRMLDRNQVAYDSVVSQELISGIELAKRVTPAVLFVKTQMGTGKERSANFRIAAKGSFTSKGLSKGDELETVQSEAIVAKNGEVIDTKDETNLPMLLGAACSLPIETLPSRPLNQWSDETGLVLPLPKSLPKQNQNNGWDPFGGRLNRGFGAQGFGGRGFGAPIGPRFPGGLPPGFGGREQPKQEIPFRLAAAISKTIYSVDKISDDIVTINYQHELRSIDDDDDFATLRIDRKGVLEFDRKQGLFVSKTVAGKIALRLGEQKLSFPTRLRYKMMSLEEYIGADVIAAKPQQKSPVHWSQQVERFLAGQTTDVAKNANTINLLAKCDVDQSQVKDVTEKLTTILKQPDPGVSRSAAIDALLNWSPAVATPYVIEEYRKASTFSRRSWILRLGRTGDARAADLLSKLVGQPRAHAVAMVALEELGSVAEPALLRTLKASRDTKEQTALLNALAKIGTNQSVATIESIQNGDAWPRDEAQRTIDAIKSRVGQE
ncbi:MAG: trypsin-like peptidase domain-containing protein [Pirellulaceae bacterium]